MRRKELIKEYEPPPPYNSEDMPVDWAGTISLIAGLIGMMRYKVASWISFFAIIFAIVNVKRSQADYRQLLTSFMIAASGLFMNYMRREVVEK
eukprot:CAMPEP_0173438264 /NCGR_PEP_ID=MMETSP1357-20121228/19882_1 /TAXON_ID=77926 /ORGANISM="Hemiselmis rufescens, Strain PCC563" /LENGTH=92 /DNA_ID=CAMNT_0014403541 /DNA_START=188 /DNA_END=466 /DNA_ORIENTATION=+